MNFLKTLLLAAPLLTLLGHGAIAQTTAAPMAAATVNPDRALFDALGGSPGLVKIADDFMPRLLADARLQPFFKDTNQTQFKASLVEQICMVSGGPCKYKGADMKSAHSQMDISKGHFNALVEVLQMSMRTQNVPFSVQNELLARLAPMHRDVITVR